MPAHPNAASPMYYSVDLRRNAAVVVRNINQRGRNEGLRPSRGLNANYQAVRADVAKRGTGR
jgi:hypothetical protein